MDTEIPDGPSGETRSTLRERIAQRLLGDIQAGGWRPGERLPPERRLAEYYGVSRVTLRAALGLLASRGAVEAARSNGWFVVSQGEEHRPGASIRGFSDWARERGLEVSARVLGRAVRPAAIDEAARLRIAPGAELFQLRRVRLVDGLVVAVESSLIPLAGCPSIVDVDFRTASLYDVLRDLSTQEAPVAPVRSEYEVEARLPRGSEARLLEISQDTPVLVAHQLAASATGQPVEDSVAVYRADRYRFSGHVTSG